MRLHLSNASLIANLGTDKIRWCKTLQPKPPLQFRVRTNKYHLSGISRVHIKHGRNWPEISGFSYGYHPPNRNVTALYHQYWYITINQRSILIMTLMCGNSTSLSLPIQIKTFFENHETVTKKKAKLFNPSWVQLQGFPWR